MGSPDGNKLNLQLGFNTVRDHRMYKDNFVLEEIRKNFASDNVTPACPEVMSAIIAANDQNVASYGADELSLSLDHHFGKTFETEVAVFPIATGTAANSIALSALVKPYAAIVCDQSAHIHTDEGGAPEFFTHGAKLICIPSADGRVPADALPALFESNAQKDVLAPPIQALSITQANEWGLVYDLNTLTELSKISHDHNAYVHMDGARIGNALAHLHCSPADITWKAGIDVLSFGGTKNGAMAADAVVFFLNERTRPLIEDFRRRLKRSGHLWSKHRYLSTQLLALLHDNVWIKNATHANAMAQRIAEGLRKHAAAQMPYERQSNEVFVILPELMVQNLQEAGFHFYHWPTPEGVSGQLVRFVTSFYTRPEDVDALLAEISS
ncbi:low specificity L-threonine aldolase [Swingsia samuiensis]|uniref:L-threonine aldolase n=1 Tax=Swingsia samuiensis TaxID=1293412 RepID=A0A4Y6UHS7_9PROT|nr:beta-eliminating lyase-related protein [Swingsia samuiensis]QDH17062.1 low specificity L-threonine aldolase [Swingsia samuiensis]